MPNAAEQRDWLAAVLHVAHGACDASADVGAMPQYAFGLGREAAVETAEMIHGLEPLKRSIGLAFSYARGWDCCRSDDLWSDAFDSAVRAWSGEISAAQLERAFAPVWSRIRDAADRLGREGDKARVFTEVVFLTLTTGTLGGVRAALARRLAERRSGVASAAKVLEDS